jgi:histone-lysine N-methyltransferase SETMAR
MLQEAFRDNAMSQSKTFLWYKRFKDRRTSVDDDERSGRPSTSTASENIAKVCEAILADHRQTIHDVCEIVRLSYGTVQCILADNLNVRRISAKFVPRMLSDDQMAHRVSECRELKQQARDDPNFISSIITSDETSVYGYDPETKQQSSQWKSPISLRPKSALSLQQCQDHVDRFFDIQGIVHQEFILPGQTVNGKFYCEVLKQLREGIQCKHPDKWKNNNWFLDHDNVPANTSLVV